MISVIRADGRPDATSAPTIAPADVPATRANEYPASSSTVTAPTWPRPSTPPPSRTRSATSGRSVGSLMPVEGARLARVQVERIGFTPVKGGRHVAHESVSLDATGPVGDRAFCLVDPARARVLRTVENPSLVRTVAHWHADV